MADATADEIEDDAPKKKSKLPLILGLLVAVLGGGGVFYAIFSGMILAPEEAEIVETPAVPASQMSLDEVAFVPVQDLVIVLGPSGPGRASQSALSFEAQLEVPRQHAAAVEAAMPRIVDVLNTYLRAVEVSDISNPGMLPELRAQMLRRLQVVTGPGHVHDLLIQKFVVN